MSPRGSKYHLSASNEIEWHSVSRGAVSSENDSNNGLFLVEYNGRAFFANRKTLEDYVSGFNGLCSEFRHALDGWNI